MVEGKAKMLMEPLIAREAEPTSTRPIFLRQTRHYCLFSVKRIVFILCAIIAVAALLTAKSVPDWVLQVHNCKIIEHDEPKAYSPAVSTEIASSNGPAAFSRNTAVERIPNVRITYADKPRSVVSRCQLVKGRRIHMNYGGGCCAHSQPLNCKTGLENGGFDMCVSYSEKSLDDDFRSRNAKTLSTQPGGGLWLWKPYVILKTLLAIEEDDVLLYTDSGYQIVANMDNNAHICLQAKLNQDVVVFAYEAPERTHSKGDAFLLMGCNFENPNCSDAKQITANAILFRKTFRSILFVSQWLAYAQDYRIMGNEPSTLSKDSPDFKANRNDQTVLSLLAKKWGIMPWPDPTQFGENSFGQSLRNLPQFAMINRTFTKSTGDKS